MSHLPGGLTKTKELRFFGVTVLLLCAAGCGSGAGPVVATTNPLVAAYSVRLPRDATVVIQFGLDTKYDFSTSPVAVPAHTHATLLVAGMKQDTTYHMRSVATFADGTQLVSDDHTFTTGSAPSGRIPDTKVTLPGAAAPASGVELLSLNPGGVNTANLRLVALDPSGNLIWYYDFDAALGIAQPIKLLPNGDFLAVFYAGTTGAGGTVREFNLAGKTIHEFTVDQLNTYLSAAGYTWTANAIHHDVVHLPNGHLLLLVNSNKDYTDLPGYSGTTTVLGDSIVDLDPDLKPVWVWSTFDHLDINRHPMLFPDWTHSNALVYSPDDGSILLSMRHQYWIIKIDYANGNGTGNILWRLGYQGDFTLQNSSSPSDWFFAQHYANIISPNTTGDIEMAMFDNGNNRVLNSSGTICGPPDVPPCYSRGLYLDVNEETMTAKILWAYPTVYSPWGGVSERLPNTDMYLDLSAPSDNPTGARVLELTNTQPPQVVWQLDVNGQNSYRTIHLPSLYPGVEW